MAGRMRSSMVLCTALVLLLSAMATQSSTVVAQDCWELQASGVASSLRGICAVNGDVCWVTGTQGTVLRTTDGGKNWAQVGPQDSGEIDFRDVHAWNGDQAVIMAAGDPDRLLITTDGGNTWSVAYEYPSPDAFFDGIVFENGGRNGWLMGDPIDGRLLLLKTADGQHWSEVRPEGMPHVPSGVAGFAASGTNLCLAGGNRIVIGLGGSPADDPAFPDQQRPGANAMAYVSHDAGQTWQLVDVPVPASQSAGIFSVTAVDPDGNNLVAVGGDYRQQDNPDGNVALSRDGGLSWFVQRGVTPRGFRSCVSVVSAVEREGTQESTVRLVTTGPSGTEVSLDRGINWQPVSQQGFHTMSFVQGSEAAIGWASGSDGRIARWVDR